MQICNDKNKGFGLVCRRITKSGKMQTYTAFVMFYTHNRFIIH
jgi:hypothetical protein